MGKQYYDRDKHEIYAKKDCALILLGLGFFTWIIIWAKAAQKSIAQEVGGIESLISNWRADAITEIQFSTDGNCPSGFEKAFIGEWVGTDTGCDCLGIYCSREGVNDNSLSKGGCNSNETRCGCDNVSARSSRTLFTVPSQDHICVRRAADLNFLKLYNFMAEDGTCADDYKVCGDVNGKSKGICIPTAEPCPITDIAFGTTNPDAGRFDETVAGTGISAYFTRTNV